MKSTKCVDSVSVESSGFKAENTDCPALFPVAPSEQQTHELVQPTCSGKTVREGDQAPLGIGQGQNDKRNEMDQTVSNVNVAVVEGKNYLQGSRSRKGSPIEDEPAAKRHRSDDVAGPPGTTIPTGRNSAFHGKTHTGSRESFPSPNRAVLLGESLNKASRVEDVKEEPSLLGATDAENHAKGQAVKPEIPLAYDDVDQQIRTRVNLINSGNVRSDSLSSESEMSRRSSATTRNGEDIEIDDASQTKRGERRGSASTEEGLSRSSSKGGLAALQSAASLLAHGDKARKGRDPRGSDSSCSEGSRVSSSSSVQSAAEEPSTHEWGVLKVDNPSDKDVLCGRGRGFFCHPGNRRMLEIVEKNKARYRAANKTKKTEIVRDVTDEIEEGGTRFLKRASAKSNKGWYEVSAIEKHKKVCHCLREEKNVAETSSASASGEGSAPSKTTRKRADDLPPATKGGMVHSDKKLLAASNFYSARSLQRSSIPGSSDFASSSSLPLRDYAAIHNSEIERDIVRRMGIRQRQDDNLNPSAEMTHGLVANDMLGTASPNMSSLGYPNLSRIASAPRWPSMYERTSMGPNFGIVMGNPRPTDVLFGQDPGFYSHGGNVHLRRLIQGSVGYPAISAEGKLVLAQRLVSEMRRAGSRFLTRQRASPPGLWYRVDDIEAETLIYRCLEQEETRLIAELTRGRDRGPPVTNTTIRTNPLATLHESTSGASQHRNVSIPEDTSHQPSKEQGFEQSSDVNQIDDDDKSFESEDDTTDDDDDRDLTSTGKTGLPSPGPYDVICGRGRGNFRHPGNRRMLRMFWNVKAKYNKGTKVQKTMIGRAIVEDITSKGGRFLKRSEKGWEEVEKKTVLRKVCHGIRDIPNDPEKRKRSIVADELEDNEDSDSPESTSRTDVGRTAPWLASEAKAPYTQEKQKRQSTSISASQRSSVDGNEGFHGINVGSPKVGKTKRHSMKSPKIPVSNLANMQVDPSRTSVPADSNLDHPEKQGGISLTREEHGSSKQTIEKPTKRDVLCGRGRGFFAHPGNRRMLQIISENTKRYKASSKKEKGVITREILVAVQSNGARFLKRTDNGGWEVARPEEALQKVCHGIRDYIASGEGEGNNTKQKDSDVSSQFATSPSYQLETASASHASRTSAEVVESGLNRYLVGGQEHWGGNRIPADHASGVPLHYVLAAHQQAEAEAAAVAAATNSFHKLTPEETLILLHGSSRLTPAETLLLREHQLQRRFL